MATRKAGANLALGGVLCIAVLAVGGVPYFFTRMQGKNLQKSDKALTGSQRQRGVYLNTGSKDAGPDPDWDPVTNTWKGKRNNVYVPPREPRNDA